MKTQRKGITPVVAIVILLIIAVAVVGMGYGFISGFIGTVTGKAAIISGASTCIDGKVSIAITNGGTDDITNNDITIIRSACQQGSNATKCPTNPTAFETISTIKPGSAGIKTENITTTGTEPCGGGRVCMYDVTIGGVTFPTRANC